MDKSQPEMIPALTSLHNRNETKKQASPGGEVTAEQTRLQGWEADEQKPIDPLLVLCIAV